MLQEQRCPGEKNGLCCPYCKFTAPCAEVLHAHKYTSHRDMDCPYCGKLLATWWAYERHLVRFHSQDIPEEWNHETVATKPSLKLYKILKKRKYVRRKKIQECEVCHEVFKSRPALTYHIAVKHSKTMYICDQCPAVFYHPMLLKSHNIRHGERTVMCHRCGRKFFTQTQLNSHELGNYVLGDSLNRLLKATEVIHKLGVQFLPYPFQVRLVNFLPRIGKIFHSLKNINLFHRRARSYTCRICRLQFSTQRALQHHLKTQAHEKFICQECGTSFDNKHEYASHILKYGLQCILCKQSFASSTAVYQHYRDEHDKSKLDIVEESLKCAANIQNYCIPLPKGTHGSVTIMHNITSQTSGLTVPFKQHVASQNTDFNEFIKQNTESVLEGKDDGSVKTVDLDSEYVTVEKQDSNCADLENDEVVIIVSPGCKSNEVLRYSPKTLRKKQ
ncbi:hypothetical protein SK128_021941 [Halocaridina rubra]|uniref:C2H2-type domain-containing protein n=1 Tax=Halocaridina rubra TaxID=373956 RepID=A0AAN8XJQ9_HALRR